MAVPPWLWGGNVAKFFELAGLHTTFVDTAEGIRDVQTIEHHRRTDPTLLSAQHLAGHGVARPTFARLTSWARDAISEGGTRSDYGPAIAKIRERAERTGAMIDAFNLCRLETATAPVGDLASTTEGWYDSLRTVPFDDEPDRHPFEHASVHVLLRDRKLIHRVKFLAVLLRIQHDPALAAGSVEHLQQAQNQGEHIFGAAGGLTEGIMLLDAYVGPLLGAMSPSIWGVAAFREFGVLIYAFGQPVTGTAGDPVELIQTLPLSGALKSYRVPSLTEGAAQDAVAWWGARLNQLFGIVTTPGVFTDASGVLDAVKQIQAIATVEQMFRRVGAIQAAWRDGNARLVLLFSVLDTVHTLTARPWAKHCDISFAEDTLKALRAAIPPAAAEILLPAAERAVDALREVQRGFYLLGNGSGTITVETAKGPRSMNPDEAAAQYIQVIRDANHGHGSNSPKRAGLTDSLLAQHTGVLPHDLGLLGYLYLLEVMVNLDRLPAILARGKRSSTGGSP